MDGEVPSGRGRRRRAKAAALDASAATRSAFGDVFGGPPRYAAPFAGVPEDYGEIFGGLASSCSIPYLDLPPLADDAAAAAAGVDYAEIFGRLDFSAFAASYEELFGERDDDAGVSVTAAAAAASKSNGRSRFKVQHDDRHEIEGDTFPSKHRSKEQERFPEEDNQFGTNYNINRARKADNNYHHSEEQEQFLEEHDESVPYKANGAKKKDDIHTTEQEQFLEEHDEFVPYKANGTKKKDNFQTTEQEQSPEEHKFMPYGMSGSRREEPPLVEAVQSSRRKEEPLVEAIQSLRRTEDPAVAAQFSSNPVKNALLEDTDIISHKPISRVNNGLAAHQEKVNHSNGSSSGLADHQEKAKYPNSSAGDGGKSSGSDVAAEQSQHRTTSLNGHANANHYKSSSSNHSISTDEAASPDYAFLNVSDISFDTMPTEELPPRPTAKLLKRKETYSLRRDIHLLSPTAAPSSSSQVWSTHQDAGKLGSSSLDAEADASSAAAAMKEAMEFAEARMKAAKELMERKRENSLSRKKAVAEPEVGKPWTEDIGKRQWSKKHKKAEGEIAEAGGARMQSVKKVPLYENLSHKPAEIVQNGLEQPVFSGEKSRKFKAGDESHEFTKDEPSYRINTENKWQIRAKETFFMAGAGRDEKTDVNHAVFAPLERVDGSFTNNKEKDVNGRNAKTEIALINKVESTRYAGVQIEVEDVKQRGIVTQLKKDEVIPTAVCESRLPMEMKNGETGGAAAEKNRVDKKVPVIVSEAPVVAGNMQSSSICEDHDAKMANNACTNEVLSELDCPLEVSSIPAISSVEDLASSDHRHPHLNVKTLGRDHIKGLKFADIFEKANQRMTESPQFGALDDTHECHPSTESAEADYEGFNSEMRPDATGSVHRGEVENEHFSVENIAVQCDNNESRLQKGALAGEPQGEAFEVVTATSESPQTRNGKRSDNIDVLNRYEEFEQISDQVGDVEPSECKTQGDVIENLETSNEQANENDVAAESETEVIQSVYEAKEEKHEALERMVNEKDSGELKFSELEQSKEATIVFGEECGGSAAINESVSSDAANSSNIDNIFWDGSTNTAEAESIPLPSARSDPLSAVESVSIEPGLQVQDDEEIKRRSANQAEEIRIEAGRNVEAEPETEQKAEEIPTNEEITNNEATRVELTEGTMKPGEGTINEPTLNHIPNVQRDHEKEILKRLEEEKEKLLRMKNARERANEREKSKLEEEKEREKEREKDRLAVERATREAHERAFAEVRERVDRERIAAARQRGASGESREKEEKASAEANAKGIDDKVAREARLKAERAAVERATAEARERAIEKARAEKSAADAKERLDRYRSSFKESVKKDSHVDKDFQRSASENYTRGNATTNIQDNGESALRHKARLERYQRTAERAAKALAEKNMRDILAQREQAERHRLAEFLDVEVKRWSNGKEGNLRALLSTLQYILGSESGWQALPLTDLITAAAVKKAYRKATLCVHPDKLQQRGATVRQKYICEKVFDLLKEAWNKFNSEER